MALKGKKHSTWTYDGRTRHPLYRIWRGMLTRCYNSKRESKYYADIEVCERWRDPIHGFSNFVEDMGERPEGYSLDRIDVYKGYSPENCRWATHYQQQNNRRIKSATGVVGVTKVKAGGYLAEICLGSSRNRLRKSFKAFEDAVSWRKQMLKQYGIEKD